MSLPPHEESYTPTLRIRGVMRGSVDSLPEELRGISGVSQQVIWFPHHPGGVVIRYFTVPPSVLSSFTDTVSSLPTVQLDSFLSTSATIGFSGSEALTLPVLRCTDFHWSPELPAEESRLLSGTLTLSHDGIDTERVPSGSVTAFRLDGFPRGHSIDVRSCLPYVSFPKDNVPLSSADTSTCVVRFDSPLISLSSVSEIFSIRQIRWNADSTMHAFPVHGSSPALVGSQRRFTPGMMFSNVLSVHVAGNPPPPAAQNTYPNPSGLITYSVAGQPTMFHLPRFSLSLRPATGIDTDKNPNLSQYSDSGFYHIDVIHFFAAYEPGYGVKFFRTQGSVTRRMALKSTAVHVSIAINAEYDSRLLVTSCGVRPVWVGTYVFPSLRAYLSGQPGVNNAQTVPFNCDVRVAWALHDTRYLSPHVFCIENVGEKESISVNGEAEFQVLARNSLLPYVDNSDSAADRDFSRAASTNNGSVDQRVIDVSDGCGKRC